MTCHKLAFDTVEAAERTAAVIAGLGMASDRTPARIYECEKCGRLHFTSRPAYSDSRDTTVAAVKVAPAFVAAPTGAPAPPSSACHDCGGPDAKLELYGKKYHRRCRTKVIESMTPEDRKAFQREQTWGEYVRKLEEQGYKVIPPEAQP